MRLTALLAGATLAAAMFANGADAAVVVRDIAVKNAGFEAVPSTTGGRQLQDGGYCRNCATDWTLTSFGIPEGYDSSGQGVYDPAVDSGIGVPEGKQFGILDSFTFAGKPYQGGLGQYFNEEVALGTTYSLSLDVVRRLTDPMGNWIAEILVGDDGRVAASGTLTEESVAAGGFAPLKISFTGDADTVGKGLGIRFRSLYNPAQGSDYRGVGIDNVRLTASSDVISAVPEPATWAMMIGGFAMVGATMRRKHRVRKVLA